MANPKDSSVRLAAGRGHRALPGPSVVPDRVLRAMHRAAPNIYAGELIGLSDTVYADLNTIAGSSGHAVIYIGNGHAAWEAALVNTLSKGDTILSLQTGRFGAGWAQAARGLGINVEVIDFGTDQAVQLERLEAALRDDKEHNIKAVITVQTETSSSVANNIPGIRSAMTACAHPALFMVDSIASFACEPFEMDTWDVDVMLTACQKGLMTPPGLGIVFIRDRVWPLHEKANLKTPYWDWTPRVHPEYFAARFSGTPPTHHLFGLREALDMLLEEGMENVWQRHHVQAQAVWAALECWAQSGCLEFNVPKSDDRSWVVTCVRTETGLAGRLRAWCESEAGLTLGIGLNLEPNGAKSTDDLFRIGHMGHLDPHSLLGMLASIETGLIALGIKNVEGGVDAAMKIIAHAQAPSVG